LRLGEARSRGRERERRLRIEWVRRDRSRGGGAANEHIHLGRALEPSAGHEIRLDRYLDQVVAVWEASEQGPEAGLQEADPDLLGPVSVLVALDEGLRAIR